MSELVAEPAVLADRVEAVRERLAAGGGQRSEEVELRVAASVTHLGIVARLLAPALAAASIDGVLLDVDLSTTWWQPVLGGPVPLSVLAPPPAARGVSAAALAERVLDGPVRALVDATRELSVSERILWGNAASALGGAVTMITAARPTAAGRARDLVSELLARPPLLGTASMNADGRLRRRTCCLIYRAAPRRSGPVCGDCVLNG